MVHKKQTPSFLCVYMLFLDLPKTSYKYTIVKAKTKTESAVGLKS